MKLNIRNFFFYYSINLLILLCYAVSMFGQTAFIYVPKKLILNGINIHNFKKSLFGINPGALSGKFNSKIVSRK